MRRPGLAGAGGGRRPRGPTALHSSCFDLHGLTITGSPTFPPSWASLEFQRLLMPNPCHSDAGGALPARWGSWFCLKVQARWRPSKRGSGSKPKRCQASHAFRLSRPSPEFFHRGSTRTWMALAPTQCSGSCIYWHMSVIRSIEEIEI